MKSKTSVWFETKCRVERTGDDGMAKKMTEQYAVEAPNWTCAEADITGELAPYGEFEITDIGKAKYTEVFFSDKAEDDKWYKCKVQFITIDEKTEKEKRSNTVYLVQAATLEGARKAIDGELCSLMDYTIIGVVETGILDVLTRKEG